MQTFWQPITEAPKDGSDVLLYCPAPDDDLQPELVVGWYGVHTNQWYDAFGDYNLSPTHFLPLPTLPGASS